MMPIGRASSLLLLPIKKCNRNGALKIILRLEQDSIKPFVGNGRVCVLPQVGSCRKRNLGDRRPDGGRSRFDGVVDSVGAT